MRNFLSHAKISLIRILRRLFGICPLHEEEASENHPPPPGGLGGNVSLIIAPSLIPGAGLGCFADRGYQRGEVVCEYTGTVLSTVQMLRTKNFNYVMGLGKNFAGRRIWLDARVHLRVKARYINHNFDSSKWNLAETYLPEDKKCVLTANRYIGEGEELYYDYGVLHWHLVKK